MIWLICSVSLRSIAARIASTCEHVAADDLGIAQRLLRQRLHRLFDAVLALVIGGAELLLEQRLEIVEFPCGRGGCLIGLTERLLRHDTAPIR